MSLPPLSKMSGAEYAKFAEDPRNLLRYNIDMPQMDYDKPYVEKPYPCYLFRTKVVGDRVRLRSVLVPDEAQAKKLLDAEKEQDRWYKTPALCKPPVETAPPASPMPEGEDDVEYAMPVKRAAAGA